MPTLVDSVSDFGLIRGDEFGLNYDIPLKCVIGDQQSSTIGCGCLQKGYGKVTIGTGTFIDINVGNEFLKLLKGINCYFGWNWEIVTTYIAEVGASGNTAIFNEILDQGVKLGFLREISDINSITEDLISAYNNDSECRYTSVIELFEKIAFKFKKIFTFIENSGIEVKYPLTFNGNASKIDFLLKCIATLSNMTIRRGFSNSTALGSAYLCFRKENCGQNLSSISNCEVIFPVENEIFKSKLNRNYEKYIEQTKNELRF